jgi:large subunit ribosomal protein L18e
MKPNELRLRLAYSLEKQSKKTKHPLWGDISTRLLSPRRNRASVNVGEINRNTATGSKVVVPGKVLGAGALDHKVTVAAFAFSQGAKAKIETAGGKCMNLEDFVEDSKSVKGVIILG